MFYNNMFVLAGNLLIFIIQVLVYEDKSLWVLLDNSELMMGTLTIGLCGAVGQIFIYLTISIFDNYLVSIITTSRKCLSVVVSNFYFNHKFTQE